MCCTISPWLTSNSAAVVVSKSHFHRIPPQTPVESLGYSSTGLSLIHGNLLNPSIRYPKRMERLTPLVMG